MVSPLASNVARLLGPGQLRVRGRDALRRRITREAERRTFSLSPARIGEGDCPVTRAPVLCAGVDLRREVVSIRGGVLRVSGVAEPAPG